MNFNSALIVAVVAVALAVPAGFVAYSAFFDDGGVNTDWSIEPASDLTYNGSLQPLVISTIDEGTIYYSLDGTNYTTSVQVSTQVY